MEKLTDWLVGDYAQKDYRGEFLALNTDDRRDGGNEDEDQEPLLRCGRTRCRWRFRANGYAPDS
ncbi:hypothetical protein AB0B88_11930 [Micromonospora haikouensis]|uniref:hypothetical protein n=1 Tax=Micromonospora haikouensis TaxID=686309 RepID=UPI00340E886D